MRLLNEAQLNNKLEFIQNYCKAKNAADGSAFDANANVSIKNIATLEAEIHKDYNIQVNRTLMYNKISHLFGEDLAKEYLRQIKEHEIYVHDETSLKPYCASISLYPFLLKGMTKMGGESRAPRHLGSFCGSFVNLVFALSAQFAGAIATVEFLTYFDRFARNDFGGNYLETHRSEIEAYLQQVVYSLNQPAAARGYQSVFWNISIYDEFYFDSLFGDFIFPEGDRPKWESVNNLQKFFMSWFNQEREKCVLTFPVVTVAALTEKGSVKSRDYANWIAKELAATNSFFVYLSDSVDSLASCCRLRNAISKNEFSYSLGAGGIATGSLNVITINMNRLVQKRLSLANQVEKIHKYQVAFRSIMNELQSSGMLPAYDQGFISMDKQYLTIGINGLVEAAEFLGHKISNNKTYKLFLQNQLKTIYRLNVQAKKHYGYMFNTEFVPAENLGVKNAKWDRKDNLYSPRDCYNSYFYVVEDDSIEYPDKLQLHGEEILQYLDGGSALHLNLEDYLSEKQYLMLIDQAAENGCNYFCTNVKVTVCNSCQKVSKKTQNFCSFCHSKDVDHATRVIGYLKKISSLVAIDSRNTRRYYHQDKSRDCSTNLNKSHLNQFYQEDHYKDERNKFVPSHCG
ncbi:MAG: anaerobic ribonucleoside-triphosphate reductase [Oligoflexia bacterium]|nr:anaerobic ribonucleoside-triphosphate reductase [Oligoflexia bacterium]